MKKPFENNPTFGSMLARSFNLLPTISSHIYFPVYSNGLKAIGRLVGCEWTAPDASGLKSIVLRGRWEVEHNDELKRELEATTSRTAWL